MSLNIYKNVKAACKEKGITVSSLEKDLGYARSSIYKWQFNSPNVEKVKAVADKLDKPMEYFLDDDST